MVEDSGTQVEDSGTLVVDSGTSVEDSETLVEVRALYYFVSEPSTTIGLGRSVTEH